MTVIKRKPTLKDIAERVGLTVNTVSLALRDSPLVVEETKSRIRDAARELGYVHNVLAGSLRTGRSHTVALVMGDIANLAFAQRIKALEYAFRKAGYQVLILNTDENPRAELKAMRTAISHQVDGVVLCPCQQGREGIELLQAHCLPFVLIGRDFPDVAMDAVVWDDRAGAQMVTEHMLAEGYEDIVFLNGPGYISSATERRMGYEQAMRAAGYEPETVYTGATSGSVGSALEALWAERGGCDGLFVFSDLMALEAADWLMRRGLSIPDDVAVAGFDDVLSHISLPFGLTSVGCDWSIEAEKTVSRLLRRIENPDIEPGIDRLEVTLMPRMSTRRTQTKEEPRHD